MMKRAISFFTAAGLLLLCGLAFATVTTITSPGVYSGQTYTDEVVINASNVVFKNNKLSTTNGLCLQVGFGTPGGIHDVIVDSNNIGPCGSVSQAIHDDGIGANGTMDITISNNSIHDTSDAIAVTNSYHGYTIVGNKIWNTRGPFYDGVSIALGLLDKPGLSPTHQTTIKCNVIDDRMGTNAHSTDHINIGESNLGTGTSSINSPLEIAYNKIRGSLTGWGDSGSGIQTEDAKNYANMWIHDNIIVEVNGCGVCVAGANVLVTNNIIENAGQSSASKTFVAYAFGGNSAACTTLTAFGNRGISKLWAWGHTGENGGANGWEPEGSHANTIGLCPNYVGTGRNNFNDTTLTADIWNTPIPQCGNTPPAVTVRRRN